jgi:hypothetical protein
MNDEKYESYGIILLTVLEMTQTDIAYFSSEGNLIFCLGETLVEGDFQIPNQISDFLNRRNVPIKIHRVENGRTFLITYGLVKGRNKNTHGVLLTKQDMGKEAVNDRQSTTLRNESDRSEDTKRLAKIIPDQDLTGLFIKYPEFREDVFTLDEQLRGLDDPLALKMIQQATVGELAKSLGVNHDALAEKIQRLIDSY